MKEFHRDDFANRTGLAQAWTVKSADRLFTYTDQAQVAATGPYWPKGARNKKKIASTVPCLHRPLNCFNGRPTQAMRQFSIHRHVRTEHP